MIRVEGFIIQVEGVQLCMWRHARDVEQLNLITDPCEKVASFCIAASPGMHAPATCSISLLTSQDVVSQCRHTHYSHTIDSYLLKRLLRNPMWLARFYKVLCARCSWEFRFFNPCFVHSFTRFCKVLWARCLWEFRFCTPCFVHYFSRFYKELWARCLREFRLLIHILSILSSPSRLVAGLQFLLAHVLRTYQNSHTYKKPRWNSLAMKLQS